LANLTFSVFFLQKLFRVAESLQLFWLPAISSNARS
jgi:hypothetical protein